MRWYICWVDPRIHAMGYLSGGLCSCTPYLVLCCYGSQDHYTPMRTSGTGMSGYPYRDTTAEVVHLVGGYVYHATGYLSGGSCIWYVGCQDTHLRTPHLRWYIWWVDLWIPCQDTSQEYIISGMLCYVMPPCLDTPYEVVHLVGGSTDTCHGIPLRR